jgi:C4-dicarboxylate-specific signal transduction histidine kinase
MGKDKILYSSFLKLRSLAEERLHFENTAAGPLVSDVESHRLIHELQVHQVELEMQNEELRQALAEIEKMEARLGRYSDLYELNEELENRVVERTKELAENIENLTAEIVEREKAQESVLRLNRLYAVVSETNQAIIRTKDRETLFNDFCRIAVEHGSFKLAWVGLVDAESGNLTIVASKGAIGYLDDIRITVNEEPTGIGPTGISVREGTYYICNDFLGSPITRPWHERGRAHGIRASASIALREEGRVIGALTLYADKQDFFNHQQVELLQQMGADISFALGNIIRENRRQQAERALNEEFAERLRAVEALREKEQMLIQQSRLAAMGEMIGNIAHQWRQPLNTLGLTIQQLPLYYDFGKIDREFLVHTVSSSMGLIQYMSKTIDDFRNYFKPDKEKIAFNVNEAISNTLTLLEGSLQNPIICIEIDARNNPVIIGYQNEFTQVILNVLINARDVLIEREIDDPKIMITISGKDGCAVVTVADNAGGIPEDIMDKIFDPYFTTKGPEIGTGVGLFMSKTIIEKNMGGRLSVRNSADGAEFRIEVCDGNHV